MIANYKALLYKFVRYKTFYMEVARVAPKNNSNISIARSGKNIKEAVTSGEDN